MSCADAAQPAVVVAGDALIDLTPSLTADGAAAYVPHPGGGSFNVAVGLGRLGVPTAFLARLSRDHWGDLLRAHLADSGVLASHLLETDDLTTLAAVHLARGGQARYSFHAAQAADRGLRPEHLERLPDGGALPRGAALHVGSIALVLEPQASTLELLMQREHGRRLISLDPNVRPSLIADHAAYVRRLEGWLGLAGLVKLSEEDLAWLYPGEREEDVVARFLAAGVRLVIVTAGAAGARAATAAARAQAPAPAVQVVDTVGAGDAFTAGALAHLHGRGELSPDALATLDDERLRAVLRAASAVAADTCTRSGADPPRAPLDANRTVRGAAAARW